ncbi:MAG: RNA methyltransferase [Bryobacteraceae bacterium]|nr:RNA methyltransferase [Bryobacteraceae bacterium]
MIESPRNERIRRYRRLLKRNFRHRERKFLAEGIQCVSEAIKHPSKPPECIICDERGMASLEAYADIIARRRIPCFLARHQVLAALSTAVTPQGLLAVAHMLDVDIESMLEPAPSTLLVADRVRDPGNLGAMVRVADAAGAGGMIVCSESADLYNPKTVRGTAGSIFHLPHCVGLDMREVAEALKKRDYAMVAAHPRAGTEHWDFAWPQKTALVLGNEAHGLTDAWIGRCSRRLTIPMRTGAESLNVAVAAGIMLYMLMCEPDSPPRRPLQAADEP